LVLLQRDRESAIRVGTDELMSSRRHGSEEGMAAAAQPAIGQRGVRVLIGGLGLGYTLRAVLDEMAPTGKVTVAEISPDVVKWNHEIVGGLAGHPLTDTNRLLWDTKGIATLARALAPGGTLVVWSSGHEPSFERRLAVGGFSVDAQDARAHDGRGVRQVLFVAQQRRQPPERVR
jgi:spermidine synthase